MTWASRILTVVLLSVLAAAATATEIRVLTDPTEVAVYHGSTLIGLTGTDGLVIDIPEGQTVLIFRKAGHADARRDVSVGREASVLFVRMARTQGPATPTVTPPPIARPVSVVPMAPAADGPGAHSAPQRPVVLPEGTQIAIVSRETLSSKTATDGDPVNLAVDEDVVVDGVLVIRRGTLVKGSVTEAKRSGAFGKAGTLNIRVDSTRTVSGAQVRLRASKGKEGEGRVGTTVALTVLFGPLGLLKRGQEAALKEGTMLSVFTDEAVTVAPVGSPIVGEPPQAAVPPVPSPPPSGGLHLGDLEQLAKATSPWVEYQSRMSVDFGRVQQFERSTADPGLRITAWERFLSTYASDNPLSTEDDGFRAKALDRVKALRSATGPTP